MKKLILMSVVFLMSSCNLGIYTQEMRTIIPKREVTKSEWELFTEALIQVESEGNPKAIGKKNDVGVLQITPIFVKEVNRIVGEKKFTLDCRTDRRKSLEMFDILQSHYNPDKDIDKAIRLHNPKASQSYRMKIMKQMKIINQKYCGERKKSVFQHRRFC